MGGGSACLCGRMLRCALLVRRALLCHGGIAISRTSTLARAPHQRHPRTRQHGRLHVNQALGGVLGRQHVCRAGSCLGANRVHMQAATLERAGASLLSVCCAVGGRPAAVAWDPCLQLFQPACSCCCGVLPCLSTLLRSTSVPAQPCEQRSKPLES
jgi:hypothetical protein